MPVLRNAVALGLAPLAWHGAASAQRTDDFHHHGMMMGWGGGPWVLLLLLVLFGVGLWLILRGIGSGGPPGARGAGGERQAGGGEAMSILEARYARGEIDDEEFERRRRALKGG